MNNFEYGDQEIGQKDLAIAVASVVIGVGILSLPRTLAKLTHGIDGWMSIVIGGLFSMFFAWVIAKLASRFPNMTFYDYVQLITTRSVAVVVTLLVAISFLAVVSFEIRAVGSITQLYMFNRTPVEVISLVFLLLVIYGVSGPSVGLLRVNLMFLPIVIGIVLIVQLFNLGFFETENLRPYFKTNLIPILQGAQETSLAFVGYGILLFYTAYINKPKKAPRAAIIGMSIPLVTYLIMYLFVIGVFSNESAGAILFPSIEIAKEVEVPGEFFERFESVFFTIWIMAIFTTAAMAYDVAIIALRSVFKRKVKRITLLLVLSPFLYIGAMMPQDLTQLSQFGERVAYIALFSTALIPTILLLIAILRGVKGNV
jgi:spore germination protein